MWYPGCCKCKESVGLPSKIDPNTGGNPVRVASKSADGVASNLLLKFENFSGQVKDGFRFIEELKMKYVWMTEPKQMATFIALGGIATALWFRSKSFSLWMELEDAFKKTWCTKLNPSDAIARACQTHQKEDGYIREYNVKFEELKRFIGEMSVPTLIDMFMRNTCCAVHDRYKELKQQDLTWEQFLTEVTVINDEEAWWDSSKRKEDDEGRHLTSSYEK